MQIGKYRIEEKLGEGAMGCVYKAWHPDFHDYVALKTIQDTRSEGRELLERFKLEGQALAKLKHQNIVQIYDAGKENGIDFIVMEYMNGGSLDRIISGHENIPLAKRVGYIIPVCQALEYAHRRKLFHRDIKPANIMLHFDGGEEIVKVVDFGIARLVDFSHTQTKLLVGAPAYMAPELLTATAKANEKTDIWALGVTLYELIAYQRPFDGNSIEELRDKIVRGRPKPLIQIVPDCPKDLASVVEKTLQKEPASRYQTVEDLLVDLEPIAKRLRTDVAANLVRRAKDFMDLGELESAKSALDEAKRYDATNVHARTLLNEVQEQIRRKELLPRLQDQVRCGRKSLNAHQYKEAKSFAENAIGLDSRYEPAQKLLADIQEAEALAEEIAQKLSYAKRCYSGGELTEASRSVNEVLSLDPENYDAKLLGSAIQSQREEIERRKKLNLILRNADDFLIQGKYDDCLALLEKAGPEFPGNLEILKRRDTALAEKSEQLRQSLLTRAKKFRASQQFDQALQVLDEFLRKFPSDSAAITLRASIQKEIDQERMTKQLGAAWEQLHSLKHEGKLRQARDLAKDWAVKFPSEQKLREFIRSVEDEIDRSKRFSLLETTIKRIQGLIASGLLLEAIQEVKEAEKQFPDNAVLLSLRKDAESQHQLKQVREKQASVLAKVRELISAAQYATAAEMARKSLVELGEHVELRETLLEAERLESARVEKLQRQELVTTQIKGSKSAWEATRIIQDAVENGVLEKDSLLHRTLLQDIERTKNEEQRAKDGQRAAKVAEIRDALDRQDYAGAVRLATHCENEFGPNPETSALLRQAESGLGVQKRREREKTEVLDRAGELLASGNVAAADLLLRKNIDAKIVSAAEPHIAELVARTRELLEREKLRKKRIQQAVERINELANRKKFVEAIELGHRTLLAEGHHDELVRLVRQLEIQRAEKETAEARKLAELQAIRELIETCDGRQAMALLEDSVRRGIFQQDDPEVVLLRQQIRQLDQPLVVATVPEQTSVPTDIRESPIRRFLVPTGIGIAVVLAASAAYFALHRAKNVQPKTIATKQELELQAESKAFRSVGKYHQAIDADRKLEGNNGALSEWARQDLAEINELLAKENSLMDAAQLAAGDKDWNQALTLYQNVIDLHGARESEASAAIETVKLKRDNPEANPSEIADKQLNLGIAAFNRKDYQSAREILRNVLSGSPQDWANRSTADKYLKDSTARIDQGELMSQAAGAFQQKKYDLARNSAAQAQQVKGGDPGVASRAGQLLQDIGARVRQKGLYDEAFANESSNAEEAITKFKQVRDFQNGDPDLVENARTEIAKLEKPSPPPNPNAALVADITNSIKQGDFDTASKKLKELSPVDPNYSQLTATLNDALFGKRTDEAENALGAPDSSSRRETLTTLLAYFQNLARGTSPNAKMASRYARDIQTALKPPSQPPATTRAEPAKKLLNEQDEDAIRALIEVKLSGAFHERDVKKIEVLWSAGYFDKNDENLWKRTFSHSSQFTRQFKLEDLKPIADDDVEVSGTYVSQNIKTDGPPETLPGHFLGRVIKSNGAWMIKTMSY